MPTLGSNFNQNLSLAMKIVIRPHPQTVNNSTPNAMGIAIPIAYPNPSDALFHPDRKQIKLIFSRINHKSDLTLIWVPQYVTNSKALTEIRQAWHSHLAKLAQSVMWELSICSLVPLLTQPSTIDRLDFTLDEGKILSSNPTYYPLEVIHFGDKVKLQTYRPQLNCCK